MKALTLWQPWASLIAVGAKTIETRSWATKYRGRIAIHAAKVTASLEAASEAWESVAQAVGAEGGYELWHQHHCGEDYFDPAAPWLPVGAVVATASLRDCVIVGRCHDPYAPEVPEFALAVAWTGDKAWHVVGDTAADATDQLPFGDFSPGRWAWLLDDIKPTTDRCPACWGAGNQARHRCRDEYHPHSGACFICQTCDGRFTCDPIPAKGKQGLWTWTPEASS